MTTIAEIQEILDRTARRDEELRDLLAEAARYNAEAARRDAEYKAAEEQRRLEREKSDAEWKRERAETDRRMKESSAKTDAAIRKLSNQFNSQWGRLVESLCKNQVVPLLNSRGIEVQQTVQRIRTPLPAGGYFEIDILAINGDTVVAFEVKTTLRPPDVDWFTEKLELARKMFRQYINCRFLGGVAFLHADSAADTVAQKRGLFTILATGNGAIITNPKEFVPKAW